VVATTTTRALRVSSVDVVSARVRGLRAVRVGQDGDVWGDVDFSPSGDRLVFSRLVDDERDGLYVVAIRGGAPRRVDGTKAFDLNPIWSPDGQTIAFARLQDRPTSVQVWSVLWAGGRPTRLKDGRVANVPVSWQPLPR
jgi:tricorn protease